MVYQFTLTYQWFLRKWWYVWNIQVQLYVKRFSEVLENTFVRAGIHVVFSDFSMALIHGVVLLRGRCCLMWRPSVEIRGASSWQMMLSRSMWKIIKEHLKVSTFKSPFESFCLATWLLISCRIVLIMYFIWILGEPYLEHEDVHNSYVQPADPPMMWVDLSTTFILFPWWCYLKLLI